MNLGTFYLLSCSWTSFYNSWSAYNAVILHSTSRLCFEWCYAVMLLQLERLRTQKQSDANRHSGVMSCLLLFTVLGGYMFAQRDVSFPSGSPILRTHYVRLPFTRWLSGPYLNGNRMISSGRVVAAAPALQNMTSSTAGQSRKGSQGSDYTPRQGLLVLTKKGGLGIVTREINMFFEFCVKKTIK